MFALRGLIVLVMANLCLINLSSSSSISFNDQDKSKLLQQPERENSNSEHLKDPITDLKRLSSTEINKSNILAKPKLSDEVLDEEASSHLGSFLSGIIDSGLKETKVIPLYEASNSKELFVDSFMHGKRRLDDDNAALASTGRQMNSRKLNNLEAGKFPQGVNQGLMEENQFQQLNQAASRAFRRQMMQNNYNNNNFDLHAGKNWPTNQIVDKQQRQNVNRRSSSIVDNGPPIEGNHFRGLNSAGSNERFMREKRNQFAKANYGRQESQKRVSKPIVKKGGRKRGSDESLENDEIFRDDDDDNNSNKVDDEGNFYRRSDDDGESRDEDEVDEDDSNKSESPTRASGNVKRSSKKNKLAAGRKMKAASEQQDEDEYPVSPSIAANEDGEEDSDSSNNLKQLAEPNKQRNKNKQMPIDRQIFINGKQSKALQAALEQSDSTDEDSSQSSSVVKSNDEDDSDQSATQLKHSSVELQAAAGHHHGHHGHYYQHVEVPKKKAWKFGFKRGNHKHEIERHEKGHKHKFHSSFKWHAKEKCKKKKKCKSVGKMTWEYKHAKKHHR